MVVRLQKNILRTYLILSVFILPLQAQTAQQDKIWQQGIEYLMDGDYIRGAEKMRAYLKYEPLSASAHANLGVCYYNLADDEATCKSWQRAVQLGNKSLKKNINFLCDPASRVKMLQKYYYKGAELDPQRGYRPQYTRADSLRGALRPERTSYDVFYYDLTVNINPRSKAIVGRNEIWFRGIEAERRIQIDLFEELAIEQITLEGKSLSYAREFNAVFIELPEAIQPGKSYKLVFEYSGKPAKAANPPWEGGFVWERDKKKNRWAGVACEQYGASSWWPNKDHLSDRPDSMSIRLEVPSKYQAIANGRLRGVDTLENDYTRYNWHVSYPINTYNATFYMGKYTEFTDTIRWKDSVLVARYHVLPYNLEKAKVHFEQAKDVVKFYNEAFGPFPFWRDDFRMVESPYEGMEHQTAIAYGNGYSNEKNAKDYLCQQFDYIIVHEAAHEWWGNAVAAGDFADVWLHEGFATYAEFLFIEHMLGEEEALKEVQHHLEYILNMWPMVHNRDVNEDAFAGGDVYNKGAALLHSLRASINEDSLFRAILLEFNLQYRDRISDSQDFIEFVNQKTGSDYSSFFEKYLHETGLPVLEYSYEREGESIRFKYRWAGVAEDFEMPFALKIIGDSPPIRLVATTSMQEILIENAESFLFYNFRTSPEGCPKNGLTYYSTSLVSE